MSMTDYKRSRSIKVEVHFISNGFGQTNTDKTNEFEYKSESPGMITFDNCCDDMMNIFSRL